MDAKADLSKMALDYHAFPTPGKISVTPTKTLANQDDLSLAYSPGVAIASMAIYEGGEEAAGRTSGLTPSACACKPSARISAGTSGDARDDPDL